MESGEVDGGGLVVASGQTAPLLELVDALLAQADAEGDLDWIVAVDGASRTSASHLALRILR
ncbi:hypothetical protein [Streptomyces sp. NPDC093105]|uniref:hypothetical protein n=1 Tax=Streptomyces sp. NPDC093105 TaxID=3366029 RepID=UPI00380A9FAF